MKIEKMTEVQQKAFRPIAEGMDVNIRSPPDTGKTLAFLLPFLNDKLSVHMIKKGIHCVFLTPDSNHATANFLFTSELLKLMGPNITVQAVYDSYSIQREVQRFSKKVPTILIATPTRLRQHLESSVLSKIKSRKSNKKVRTDFCNKFTQLTKTLVLDEADVLLRDHSDDLEFIRPYLSMGDDAQRHTILLSSSKNEIPQLHEWTRENVTIDCMPRPKPSENIVVGKTDFANAEDIQAQTKLLRKRWVKESKRIKAEWKEKVSVQRPTDGI